MTKVPKSTCRLLTLQHKFPYINTWYSSSDVVGLILIIQDFPGRVSQSSDQQPAYLGDNSMHQIKFIDPRGSKIY